MLSLAQMLSLVLKESQDFEAWKTKIDQIPSPSTELNDIFRDIAISTESSGRLKKLEYLLAGVATKKFNIDIHYCGSDPYQATVVHALASSGNIDGLVSFVNLLTKYKIKFDYSKKDLEGKTTLLAAIMANAPSELIKGLINEQTYNNPDISGITPMWMVLALGRRDVAFDLKAFAIKQFPSDIPYDDKRALNELLFTSTTERVAIKYLDETKKRVEIVRDNKLPPQLPNSTDRNSPPPLPDISGRKWANPTDRERWHKELDLFAYILKIRGVKTFKPYGKGADKATETGWLLYSFEGSKYLLATLQVDSEETCNQILKLFDPSSDFKVEAFKQNKKIPCIGIYFLSDDATFGEKMGCIYNKIADVFPSPVPQSSGNYDGAQKFALFTPPQDAKEQPQVAPAPCTSTTTSLSLKQ